MSADKYPSIFSCQMATIVYIYMLFAGWEVLIVKNCDLGLENAALGLRPREAFSRPRSQFFTFRTEPMPANNFFFPAINWLTSGFTQLCH